MISPVLAALVALGLAACGADGPSAGGASTGAETSPPLVSEPDPSQLYEGDGRVCEDGARGPRLWLGADSLLMPGPPTCGGIPLVNWDWQAVEGESSEGGTTWGSYHVAATYDGEALSVTGVGPYEHDPSVLETDPDTTSPCDEPEGGWIVPDPAHNTTNEVKGASRYASSQPDYVASWITFLEPARLEFGPVLFNAVFTGDVERHEAEIRKVWEGPLCIVARDVPMARELARVRKEVEAGLGDLGLEMLWSQGPAVDPVVEIGVVVNVGGQAEAALDRRYGPGVVRLVPALKPVS